MKRESRDILSRVFLNLERFLPNRVCVAFSGGADSLFLLYVLKKRLDVSWLSAVHINHQIRGSESDRDEEFCRAICKKWNISLKVFSTDIPAYAQKKLLSLEMAAREYRYRIFQEIHVQDPKLLIATAHHQDDLVETMLMRLFKGTGSDGLVGISETRSFLFRPLLTVSRREIETVLQDVGLDFRTDSTNLEIQPERNYIRHKVIPVIQKKFPAFKRKMQELKLILEEENAFFEDKFKDFEGVRGFRSNRLVFSKKQVLEAFPHPAEQSRLIRFFFHLWKPEFYLTFKILRDLRGFLFRSDGNKVVYQNNDFHILSVYEELVFEIKPKESKFFLPAVRLNIPDSGQLFGDYLIALDISSSVERSRKDSLFWQIPLYVNDTHFLTVRSKKAGDRICIGEHFHKKLQDLFVDEKLSLVQREQAVIFCSEAGNILAIFTEENGFRRAYQNSSKGAVLEYYLKITKNKV